MTNFYLGVIVKKYDPGPVVPGINNLYSSPPEGGEEYKLYNISARPGGDIT